MANTLNKIVKNGVEYQFPTGGDDYYTKEESDARYVLKETPIGEYNVVLTLSDGTVQTDTYEDGIIPVTEYLGNTAITSVEIGDMITEIGTFAFFGCFSLTSVTIPNSVTSIGGSAFYGVPSSGSLYCDEDWYDNLSSTLISALDNVYNWTRYDLPKSIEERVDDLENDKQDKLTAGNGIDITDNVISATGNYVTNNTYTAYTAATASEIAGKASQSALNTVSGQVSSNTTNISTVSGNVSSNTTNISTLSGNVSTVSGQVSTLSCKVSTNTSNISTVSGQVSTVSGKVSTNTSNISTLSGKVSTNTSDISTLKSETLEIEINGQTYIFYGVVSTPSTTVELTLSDGTTQTDTYSDGTIPSQKYKGNTNIVEVVIRGGITTIGANAFSGCSNINSVVIGNGVTTIGEWAFRNCSNIRSFKIPASVTSIATNAFAYCSAVTTFSVDDANSVFYSDGNCILSAQTVCFGCSASIIPQYTTTIGTRAFMGQYNLHSITIPESVTLVNNYAFYNCSSLKSITCNASSEPTIDSSTFRNIASGGTLYTPNSSDDWTTWMSTSAYYLGYYGWTQVKG